MKQFIAHLKCHKTKEVVQNVVYFYSTLVLADANQMFS